MLISYRGRIEEKKKKGGAAIKSKEIRQRESEEETAM